MEYTVLGETFRSPAPWWAQLWLAQAGYHQGVMGTEGDDEMQICSNNATVSGSLLAWRASGSHPRNAPVTPEEMSCATETTAAYQRKFCASYDAALAHFEASKTASQQAESGPYSPGDGASSGPVLLLAGPEQEIPWPPIIRDGADILGKIRWETSGTTDSDDDGN